MNEPRMTMDQVMEVRVAGPLACFTRPENKGERVSYPVMTPSAARGILEAIYWKPEFSWIVREIQVLRPIEFISIRRNEISNPQSQWLAETGRKYFADDFNERTQRHTLALRNVAYLIRAEIIRQPGATENDAKHRAIFSERVERGRCFQQPFLGCREFAADFEPRQNGEKPREEISLELGRMLLDVKFKPNESGNIRFRRRGPRGPELVRGIAEPQFFEAKLEKGVLYVARGVA